MHYPLRRGGFTEENNYTLFYSGDQKSDLEHKRQDLKCPSRFGIFSLFSSQFYISFLHEGTLHNWN